MTLLSLIGWSIALIAAVLTPRVEARTGYFWHITDLHLDTLYSTQGDVMRSCWPYERQSPGSSARSPGRFGDYMCDSPWSLIESAAKAMKSRQGDNVEFVLWTGDGLSHSAHPMFETKKLEILRNITDLLGRTFSSQFVFPVLGHEDGTNNFRYMGELWRHWLPTEALHTFEKGGYYSIEQTKSRLRIIALNTNYMRHDPKYSQSHLAAVRQRGSFDAGGGDGGYGGGPGTGSSTGGGYKSYYYHHGSLHQHHGHGSEWTGGSHGYGYNGHHRAVPGVNIVGPLEGSGGHVSALSEYENQDTEKQWLWLEDVLYKSKNNKETVYIVGHIPPGSDERHIGLQQNGHTTFTESNNKRYLDLVRKYSSIIQGQFFGHLHSDSFRIIYDGQGNPVSWMMISPSVTPRKSVGSNNPAMRLYKFDTDSGQVLDYTQYYMDLQVANTLGEPNWVPEYNLTHYYALSDISAISLHNFVERFTGTDTTWFTKYHRANTVRYMTEQRCDNACMLNHFCAITRVDYKEFRQCFEKDQSAMGAASRPALNAACPLLVAACVAAASLASTCSRSLALMAVGQRTSVQAPLRWLQLAVAALLARIAVGRLWGRPLERRSHHREQPLLRRCHRVNGESVRKAEGEKSQRVLVQPLTTTTATTTTRNTTERNTTTTSATTKSGNNNNIMRFSHNNKNMINSKTNYVTVKGTTENMRHEVN